MSKVSRFFQISKQLVVALCVLSIAIEVPASALKVDEKFYSSNQAIIYDPRAQCSAAGSSSTATIEGSENIEKVLKYFTGKGFSLASAAGFVGNMTQESGVNPRAIEPSKIAPEDYTPVDGQGFGLVQWTFSSRQKPLVALAKSTSRKTTDMELQLDYIWKELNEGYKGTLEALVKAEKDGSISPKKAAIIIHGRTRPFMNNPEFADAPKLGYETSGDSNYAKFTKDRIDPAIGAYNRYRESIKDGSGITIDGSATASLEASNTCSGSVNGSAFTIDGMAFPLIVNEETIRKGSRSSGGGGTWCYAKETNCHHDYNAADIMAPPGTVVVAAKGGEVVSARIATNGVRCSKRDTITIRSDDGNIWFYTHLKPNSAVVKNGQKVSAGAKLAVVGESGAADCTAPHLHIDQLPSKYKARVSCASARCSSYPFIDIQPQLHELYEKMISAEKGL